MRPDASGLSRSDWRQHVTLHRHEVHAAERHWLIDAVKDQDALLAAADRFEVFPYGLLLWDSAPVLADALRSLGDLTGQRVLELGAGVGLAGLAARHLGAEVVQTDHAAEALQLARSNADLNGISGVAQELAEWSEWTPPGRFDVIAGSDILYDAAAHAVVARLLAQSLADGGVVLLTDPGRTATPRFVDAMKSAGWSIETSVRQVPALHSTRPGEQVTITLLRLER